MYVCLCFCVGSCENVYIYLQSTCHLNFYHLLIIIFNICLLFPFLVFHKNQGLEFSFVDKSSQFGICLLIKFSQPISPSFFLNLSVVHQD